MIKIIISNFGNILLKTSEVIVYAYFNNDLNELNKNPRLSLSRTLLPLYILTEVIKDSKKIKVIYLSSASIWEPENITCR